MSDQPVDARWPRLLALAVHEFRTPMTVVAGYIRMLLKDRAGPLSDQQRRLLEEAEKSCGRLSALVSEMSELSNLEAGTATFNQNAVALGTLLEDTIGSLPTVPDRAVEIELVNASDDDVVRGDAARLKSALLALLGGLRRELVTSNRLIVRQSTRDYDGQRVCWIAIGDADHVDGLTSAPPDGLTAFDEWRGGCGLGLAVARRVIAAHGGRVWSPLEDGKASGVVMLPRQNGSTRPEPMASQAPPR